MTLSRLGLRVARSLRLLGTEKLATSAIFVVRGAGAMRELKSWFVGRAVKRGVQRAKAEEVFSWIEGFGRYGFARNRTEKPTFEAHRMT